MVESCSHRRHSSGHYSVCGYGLVEDTMSFDASKVERYTMSEWYNVNSRRKRFSANID